MDNEVHPDDYVTAALGDVMEAIDKAKPKERSELARRYQVLKTELEKLIAYHDSFIVRRNFWPFEENKE